MINEVVNYVITTVKQLEGFKENPYIDPLRLEYPEQYGLDKEFVEKCNSIFSKLKVTFGYGFTNITQEEANAVLTIRLSKLYIKDLHSLIPNIENHPIEIQGVFLIMIYQLGYNKLSKFKKTLKYLSVKDYFNVSREMLDSKWARQTASRAKHLSNIVKSFSQKGANDEQRKNV